jgi:hypothetical protein
MPNEAVPGPDLPQWDHFQRFVGMIAKVPKEEADKVGSETANTTAKRNGKERNVPNG